MIPTHFGWILLLDQQVGKNKARNSKEHRSRHTSDIVPSGIEQVILITILRCQQAIYKMPFEHHTDSKSPDNIYKNQSRGGLFHFIGFAKKDSGASLLL